MKIWLRRVAFLWLTAMGIALLAFTYNNQQTGYKEFEVVQLQIENHLSFDEINTDYPGINIVEMNRPEFNQKDFPCMWWALNDLEEKWPADSCERTDFIKFQQLDFVEKTDVNLVVFNHRLIKCFKSGERAVFNYLGEYNSHIKTLAENHISAFSHIRKVLNELESGISMDNSSKIPLKEWNKLVARYLDPLYDSQCFRYNGKVYGPEFNSDFENMEGEIASLSIILKIIGAVLFLLGFLFIRKLYFRKRGIMVNPLQIAGLYDGITFLFAVPSAWLLAGIVLQKLLFIQPLFNEMELTFMGIFFFLFGIPFVSVFTSRIVSQSVQFNSIGILVDSLSEKNLIKWESLQSIEFSNEYVLVGRVGTIIPKKLQKSLKFTDSDNNSVVLNEPQLKSVKKKIITHFQKYAPIQIREKFLRTLKKW